MLLQLPIGGASAMQDKGEATHEARGAAVSLLTMQIGLQAIQVPLVIVDALIT